MSSVSDTTVVVAARDVLSADFDPDLVLLKLQDGTYYGLDDVGARVWALLQSPVPLGVIRDTITSEFDVEPARCTRDIQAFVADLIGRGLVDVCTDGA